MNRLINPCEQSHLISRSQVLNLNYKIPETESQLLNLKNGANLAICQHNNDLIQKRKKPYEYIRCSVSKTMIPKTACKYKSVTSIDLLNQCLKLCSWIPKNREKTE